MKDKEKQKYDSALKVNKGVDQPSSIDNDAIKRYKGFKRIKYSIDDYLNGIRSGNKTVFSKAITLVESTLLHHQEVAQKVIEKCLPYSGKSLRLGITGVPGVGKSTFIEALGLHLIQKGHKIAVLAIDPSSERSKGSILGDKTRMEKLANHQNAFIRPSASAGSLGGVARKTREAIVLCEAAGYDIIFVETVGVGQSEIAVHAMVDFFLLLMLAGAGDELQGIKKGIMEMADAIVINKADGDNLKKAKLAKREYENALHLFPPAKSGWIPRVDTCSSLYIEGIKEIWEIVLDYMELTKGNGYFNKNRQEQAVRIMIDTIKDNLTDSFFNNPVIKQKLEVYKQKVLNDEISSYVAAQELMEAYFRNLSQRFPNE